MNIDIVIIGRNTEKTLPECIESILNSDYPDGDLSILYVDSGSSDRSCQIASSYDGVTVLELSEGYPSPGAGRNIGWKAGSAPLIQFLDSDTVLAPQWLSTAAEAMGNDIGAVRGNRTERFPEKSIFNWIADQEWNAPPGDCDSFGGDVLVRRSVLESTGGYNETLVGGEDPELSRRICEKNWRIVQLDEPMTTHDMNMHTIRDYWKRSFRTGYGYAAVVSIRAAKGDCFWRPELRRIVFRGCAGPLLIAIGLLGATFLSLGFLVAALAGLALIFSPRLRSVTSLRKEKALEVRDARIYAWHCSFHVIPGFLGALRFWIGSIFNRPLRNSRYPLRAENCS